MRTFWQVLNETQGMGVPFLYPLGYQGVGQYPPQYLTALFPDALIYIAADERLQHCWEAEPFKIDHLGPQPIFNIKYGKESLVSTHPKLPPGNSVPWKSIPPDPDEKLYPDGPAHPCMISEPKCLPGNVAGLEAEKFGDPCHGQWKMPENYKGNHMKTFKQYMELMEARKMSKSASEKWQRIECEDCDRVYHIPKAEYDREVKRTGKWKQYPDEDCPYCRHENDMDDPMPGQRRARHGDHTGIAEGKRKEYAPLVGAQPDNILPAGAQPMNPDEFPHKTVVTEKRKPKGKMMKLE